MASDGWISVTKKLPATGALSWIVWSGTVQNISYRRVGLGFACADGYAWEPADGEGDSIPDDEVTHWREIPAPPGAPREGKRDETR